MTITTDHVIPFNRPHLTGDESELIAAALACRSLEGDGRYTSRATDLLTKMVGATSALLTTSCTHALEMSALLLDLEPGDEVVMPSFTFPSTANGYALRGAVPVFVDCRPDTLNMDERLLEDALTERTRAIVVVHYGGVACEMDAIMEIADRHDLPVVEDNSHGLGASYRGQQLGSLGVMATQSFHSTKNAHCGEGGALLFNGTDHLQRAELIREKGTNRRQFFRGEIDKYQWVDIGSSYLPSDLLAACLIAQLENFDAIQARRLQVWDIYQERLAGWAERNGVVQPTVPEECAHPAHLYYLLLPDLEHRHALMDHLAARGIRSAFHYMPLHSAPAGRRYGRTAPGGCPVTERVADQLLRLPVYTDLTDSDVERVLEAVTSFRVRA
ncbi:dTDP-4-amino-4,6-dideoxygalactose transaminase [Streptomyces cyanogenus]|uniref:dTDP-4-amino-4,6-dideoxygalactose transaminase n=1 Tax=Streptomyces cyanogenus TaxID=80860 RepID=A0ABX7TLL0_STRCY|nr:dTDP-4-amino-4,6-dideoxygalactose transaminase [Streptomyces cyanogenus]QTD96698.1 dTDP-4-amino-4,6-dideoxygalactose transaminase [Streptomyces cyanogenus]